MESLSEYASFTAEDLFKEVEKTDEEDLTSTSSAARYYSEYSEAYGSEVDKIEDVDLVLMILSGFIAKLEGKVPGYLSKCCARG